MSEDWEAWFPQEWIGWILYGLPSERPTEHWVSQPTSEGPTDTENFITDDNGKRVFKKPPGRVVQRARETCDSTMTKTTSDNNTMMSHRLIQIDQELQIANSSHNLRIIELLQRNAVTDEEKDNVNECMREYLIHEGDLLRKRLATNKSLREKPNQPTQASQPSIRAVERPTPPVSSTANASRNMSFTSTPGEESEIDGEFIKLLNSFEYVLD